MKIKETKPVSLQQRLDILFKKKAENNFLWSQNKISYDTWKNNFDKIDNLISEVE